MDYSESQESQHQDQSKDLQRLHTIWKNIKQSKQSLTHQQSQKQSNQKSINSIKKSIQNQQHKNYQARLAFTEKQLAKARQNTALLMKKLGEAEEQIQFFTFELDREKKQKEDYQEEIENMRSQIKKNKRQETFGKQKRQSQIRQKQFLQNSDLKKRLEFKEKQIDRLSLKIKSLQLDKRTQDSELKNSSEINEMYKKKLEDAENAMNQAYLGDQSKGAQLLELDEAIKTIQRLVLLLRNTEQFRKLGNFAEDFKEIHFLKNIQRRMKSNQLLQQAPQRKKFCSCMEVKIDERMLWTPASCYKTLLDLKLKYQEMNEECIQEILFELNKIWLAKEQLHVGRVKQSYEIQLVKWKKKSEERYDEMVARKQIQRLKKELQESKFNKKSSPCSSNQNLDLLKNIGQYEDQLRLKQKEIKLLQERIKLMETENNNYDKVLYLEGALWIIDKILVEIQNNCEDIHQFQNRFRENSHALVSKESWTAAFKEFFESISEINNSLVERLMVMKDSTLKKMGNHRVQIREPSVVDSSRRFN